MILTAALVVIAIASLFVTINSATDLITGYAAAGQTTPVGNFSVEHPQHGAAKGNIRWVIYDGENIIASDAPEEIVTVYFVPQNEEVDLDAEMECEAVGGALNNVDADDEGSQCVELKYDSPTSYECTVEDVTIYKTNTSLTEDNEGCFAARVAGGDYDIYI